METEPNQPANPSPLWRPTQVIVMTAICLVVGLPLGYLLRGSAPTATTSPMAATTGAGATGAASPAAPAATATGMPDGHPQLTMEDMKRMADKKAEPLLAKLKTNPKDAETLNQLGILYKATHQFKEAEGYFEKSLEIDPKHVNARIDLASCLYFTGDVDGALAQLNKALTYDPTYPGTLMNIGIIKWKGKNDAPGAIAAWQTLLKLNPDFAQKDAVQRMISEAEKSTKTPG